ncbi:PilN domain-containing protein [Plectonema radiosum NIES-515]|jgi:type IV pilus assembly protein PilN|uniref:PilN domain-containing protein n=1 Tax=Plectonema radiosum NIES-515 TaxID=2986073 RepID=A0ABT3B298_9CYAN|nr:PilN domain-containing protein [Plectonema radiosum]MCV3215504.1 PilN domain-containing protein [Plectonema radiosum NIES-515]
MYSLDVNFLKDRAPQPKNKGKKPRQAISLGDLTPIYIGATVGVIFPALVGGGWWFLQGKNSELGENIAKLEQQNQQLESQVGNINKIKEETNKIKAETQALVSVFDQIRPWSAMLQDMRDRIPATVQIENIKQIAPTTAVQGQPAANPASGVEITGYARSFNDVNDFLLSLQQSRFLKSTDGKITTAELVDAPIPSGTVQPANTVLIKPPQIVKYTIQSIMSDVPASQLTRELEQKGTVGLVSRIRSLQQTGVISK